MSASHKYALFEIRENWMTYCVELAHLSVTQFTVDCLVMWPFSKSEAGVDVVLICKCYVFV